MRYVPLVLGPTLLQMVGLILLVQLSSYIKAEYRRRMIAACTLVITMIMKNYLTSVCINLNNKPGKPGATPFRHGKGDSLCAWFRAPKK